jgi:geranylgeranyl diphosphate synthase type I
LAIDSAGAVNPADGSGGPACLARAIAETGAPAQLEEMIKQRVAEAVAVLTRAPIRPEARAALIDLAVRATHRPA